MGKPSIREDLLQNIDPTEARLLEETCILAEARRQLIDLVVDVETDNYFLREFADREYRQRLALEKRVESLIQKWQDSRTEVATLAAQVRALQDVAA